MSGKTDSDRTLSSKLVKRGRAHQLAGEKNSNAVPDIEDAAAGVRVTKSQYFSPLQTRQQRKANMNPLQKLELPERKTKQKPSPKHEPVQEQPVFTKIPSKVVDNRQENLELSPPLAKVESSNDNKIDANTPQWEPLNWQKVLENIRQMRSSALAPVDSMGCHKCADDAADEKTQRFQKLVALMLSSQTKDETTYEAMQRLKKQGLTPEAIVTLPTSKLEELLCPVSFYKNKAKHLQKTAQILIDKYGADIPNNIKELVALPGVGPKMAHICMATAWNEVTGIGVDVHVHRISNRLRWMPKETKEPEQTRVALEAWLPRHLWQEVNHLLVGFGQTTCTPVRPHCGECLNRDICPAADKEMLKKKVPDLSLKGHKDPSPSKAKIQKKNG